MPVSAHEGDSRVTHLAAVPWPGSIAAARPRQPWLSLCNRLCKERNLSVGKLKPGPVQGAAVRSIREGIEKEPAMPGGW